MPISSKDRTVLDVVQGIVKDLRHNQAFCDQLTQLDDEQQREVARKVIQFLWRAVNKERKAHE